MITDLSLHNFAQVFLNYPFDADFETYSHAMHFGVVAAGLIPVCAKDLTTSDRPRLPMLVEGIIKCQYSAHDFSKLRGEGADNFARMNMPLEMGMALFYALQSQHPAHRCAFFVANSYDYKIASSDLSGLDLITYDGNELSLVANVYEWLRDVIQSPFTKRLSTIIVKEKYNEFKKETKRVKGSGKRGHLSHDEAQELMYMICSKCKWWPWRTNYGRQAFPKTPLTWKH